LLVGAGVVGVAFTTAVVVVVAVQPFAVTVRVYTPDAKEVGVGIEGFCTIDEKLFGPAQV